MRCGTGTVVSVPSNDHPTNDRFMGLQSETVIADTTSVSNPLKELHDRLMADKPDGAVHDEAQCPICAMETIDNTAPGADGPTNGPQGGSMTTFTQEQMDAAVAAAVAEATTAATADTEALKTRVAELESAQQSTEVGKAVADATAPLSTQIADLQGQLDEAVLARTAAEEAKTNLEEWWKTEIEAHQTAEAAAARKDERVTKVKEAASFPDEYLEANADRFAAMSDEDFEARLEEWRTIAPAAAATPIPGETVLTAAREGANGATTNNGSMLGELGSLRHSLTDPRTL